jgi:hypothetical protein
MHLQQTKRESAKTGGPQYYFHNLTEPVKTYLRSKGAVSVALVTPYGATKSDFKAVSEDKKLESGNIVSGRVGHDRIQQGIGEAIRYWYDLPAGQFERIDIEIETIDDAFYIRPTSCKYAGSKKPRIIKRVERPLTFTSDYLSPFWKRQLEEVRKLRQDVLHWSLREIARVAKAHRPDTKVKHVQEVDLLRASGPRCIRFT